MKKKNEDKKSSEYISEFLAFTRNITQFYDYALNALSDCDKASIDLMHQLELGSYKDRGKFATQLAHIRRDRRKHKDFIDINESICSYIRSKEFTTVYRRLEQLLGDVRKSEAIIRSSRKYRPRRLTNLTIDIIEKGKK